MKIYFLSLLLVALILQYVSAYILEPLEAKYKITTDGLFSLDGQATQSLEVANNNWVVKYDSSLLTAEVHEKSNFTIKNYQIMPQKYIKNEKNFNNFIKVTFLFDWQQNTLQIIDKEVRIEKLLRPVLDPLSLQVQLRYDILQNKERLIYTVMLPNKKLATVNFRIEAYRNLIKTPMGVINTVRVQGKLGQKDYYTVWFAPKWNYLLVRFKQNIGDKSELLELTEAKVDGKIVKGDRSLSIKKQITPY